MGQLLKNDLFGICSDTAHKKGSSISIVKRLSKSGQEI